MTEKKYVKCGCVENSLISSSPILCANCNFGDDEESCKSGELEYYLYKEVKK